MLTSSTSTSTVIPSILVVPVSEKLTRANYPLWSAQVLPAIRATQLEDLILSVEKAPEKEITVVIDNKSAQLRRGAPWLITKLSSATSCRLSPAKCLCMLRDVLPPLRRGATWLISTRLRRTRDLSIRGLLSPRRRSFNYLLLITMQRCPLLHMILLRPALPFVMMNSSLIFLPVWMKNTTRCSLSLSPGLILSPPVNCMPSCSASSSILLSRPSHLQAGLHQL
jgi:hypothetical protein